MQSFIFFYISWLSTINCAACLVYYGIYNDKETRGMPVKAGFKALNFGVCFSSTAHFFAILLSIFYAGTSYVDGPSILVFLCFSTFLLIPLWVVRVKQKSVFENKKYLFRVEKVENLEDEKSALLGYIIQGAEIYKCRMNGAGKHKVGDRLEVEVWKIPFFGAFVVGEDRDV